MESYVTQSFLDKVTVLKDNNIEMIVIIKDFKNQNICDPEKCVGNNHQNKGVIKEEFMFHEEQ